MSDERVTERVYRIDPTPREEMQELIQNNAKGFDVFRFGSGLAFVPQNIERIQTWPTEILEDHAWSVTGMDTSDLESGEIAIFIEPTTAHIGRGDE